MRLRRGLALIPIALLLVPALPGTAWSARGVPDSLALVRSLFASGRPGDPALLALAERVVSRRQQARGARPAGVADALEVLGRVRLARVEYPAADSVFRLALELRRADRRADPLAIATSLGWLAEAQRVTKQLARAESTATEALRLLPSAAVPDTALEIRLRGTLGNVFAERGDGPRSCEELARAVRLAEARAHPDSLQLGQACRNLARAMAGTGDLRGARATYERAAAIQEQALGPDHPELATTLFMSAMTASVQGDYVAQRRYAERALAIRENAFGPGHPVVAIAASTLGSALRELGDFEGALPLYERAVAIQRAAARPNPFDLALALNNLGSACLMVGDGARARSCLEEARAVREKAFGPGAGSGAWSGVRLALAMSLTGDAPAARREIERAITRVDATNFAADAPDLVEALQVQGGFAHADDRLEAALASYERAFTLADSMFGPASPHTLDALALRAIVRAGLGRRAEAWADARRLEAASLEVLQLSARSLSEHEALTLERSRASGLDVMLALAADSTGMDPRARAELADAVVRARLLVLDQLADERRMLPRDAPVLAEPVKELEEARDALARVMVETLRQDRALDSTVVRARARREAAERALAERSERFGLGLRRSDAGFAEVAAALPAGSALVSYVRHDAPGEGIRKSGSADSSRLASRRYTALVHRAGATAPVLVTLGPAARLETAVARWLEACATPPPAGAALARAAERRCDALGRTVRALVWDPVARALDGAERVFVVPDGALHAVNFMALPGERGGYLVEGARALHRLTAERDLLPWAGTARPGRGLLALGGADFDRAEGGRPESLAASLPPPAGSRSTVADSLRLRFTPLPHTAAEVEQVVSIWRSSRSPDADEAAVYTGSAASEAAFKRLAPERRVLHVATHGFALGGDARDPVPAGMRGVGSVVSAGRRSDVRRRAPLLPGLALAGANAPAAGGEDGFLTAEEITSLDLTGAEWAVLSACETGLSDPGGTEAVHGLQRAFRRAGLRTVIMSLWAVDDEATRAWMKHLYTSRLLEHLDTAEAVRSACREVLRGRRGRGLDTHPFHWAAFVAAGDWR